MSSLRSLVKFTNSSSATKTVLWAGFVAGNLDAIAGVIAYYLFFQMNPVQVLQFIASGVYGPTAIGDGAFTAVAGTVLHFVIAYVCAIIYFVAYPKMKVLQQREVLFGLLFGLGIWLVMNLLVLPASNIPKSPFNLGLAIVGIGWHMLLVGLPIALITGQYYSYKAAVAAPAKTS